MGYFFNFVGPSLYDIVSYGQHGIRDCESTRDRVTNWLYLFLVPLAFIYRYIWEIAFGRHICLKLIIFSKCLPKARDGHPVSVGFSPAT